LGTLRYPVIDPFLIDGYLLDNPVYQTNLFAKLSRRGGNLFVNYHHLKRRLVVLADAMQSDG
jgi:hypothetical protein